VSRNLLSRAKRDKKNRGGHGSEREEEEELAKEEGEEANNDETEEGEEATVCTSNEDATYLKCANCFEEKVLADFYRDAGRIGGGRSRCKACEPIHPRNRTVVMKEGEKEHEGNEEEGEEKDELFEVQTVTSHRYRKGRVQYRIKWKDYDGRFNSW
jgi:hypothetical protein